MEISKTVINDLLKSIQNKFGYTLLEISQKIGVTEAALSRWNNGKSEPTKKNFLKLKELESGTLQQKAEPLISPLEERMIRMETRVRDDIACMKRDVLDCCNRLEKLISQSCGNDAVKEKEKNNDGRNNTKVNQAR